MTEQPLWQRQQAAYAAERAAQSDTEYRQATEGTWPPAEDNAYIRPDGSFVHVRDDESAPGVALPPSPLSWGVQGVRNVCAACGQTYPLEAEHVCAAEPRYTDPSGEDIARLLREGLAAAYHRHLLTFACRASDTEWTPPATDDPDTADFTPAERKALRALLREQGA